MPANRAKTGNKTSFKPGQSGNPNGRPKQTQEQKDALAMMKGLAPVAVEWLQKILTDSKTKPETRLRAIEMVLDRVYGKAVAREMTVGNELIFELLRKIDGECDV